MADYDTTKFNLFGQPLAGRKTWIYEDSGPLSDVDAVSGFVTDGASKGCDSGDLVIYTDTSRNERHFMYVSALTDTGNSQVTLTKRAEDTA